MTNPKLATVINRIEQWADGLQYYVSQTWRRDVAEAGLDGLPEEPGMIAEAIRDDMVVVLRLLRASDETRAVPALPMRMDEPWSLPEVLAKLIEATEHSLNVHSCDNHGHELYRSAVIAGRSILHEWQNTAPAQKANSRRPCDWPDTHAQPCECSVNYPPPANGGEGQ